MRDIVSGLDSLAREQRVHRAQGGSFDVIAVARDGELGAGVVLKIRSGLLLGRDAQRFEKVREESDADLISSLVSRHYLSAGDLVFGDLPEHVLLSEDFEDRALLQDILSGATKRRVQVLVPREAKRPD